MYHKGGVAIMFWDENRLWLGSGGLKFENPAPKFERKSHPDHWGGLIAPKLCGPSSYVHQHGLHQKSHISGHLPRRPPLGKYKGQHIKQHSTWLKSFPQLINFTSLVNEISLKNHLISTKN
jgi:hypothetical protein